MMIYNETIGDMIDRVADTYSNNDAIVNPDLGLRYDYDRFLAEIDRAARGMMSLGIAKGDRIALWATNYPEWIIAMFATAKIGAIMVPLDSGTGGDTLKYILNQSEARAVIMEVGRDNEELANKLLLVRDDLPSLEKLIVLGGKRFENTIPWSEVMEKGDDIPAQDLSNRQKEINPYYPFAIMYTSGTTGDPKGVVVDHRCLITNSMHSSQRMGITDKDILCLTVPLSHMFGNTVIVLAGCLRGATIVIPAPVFDPAKVLATIPKEQCTAIYGSPSMFISLVEHPEFSRTDWKTLKKGGMGGTACPRELMKKVVDEIGVTGMTVLYGISETVGILSMTYPADPVDIRVSTIGKPLPCYEVKIIDPASGEELPANEKGELCARGLLMKEYYKRPAATAGAIDRNGWFHSGDLAKKDNNGYIQITGRLQDVILRDGQEIYPTEVEEVIYALPQVSEVQVFPVPDKQKGQEMAAWIKIREGATLSIEEVREYCKKHLKEIQLPKYFKFITDFPLTRTGKYQKFKLTEMAAKEYGV